MDANTIITLISTIGFPIVACLVMGWFIYKIYVTSTKANEDNMTKVQERCAAREEKLYQQIRESQEINGKAIATITLYAERLGTIEADVREIKEDIVVIAEKIS